MRRIAWVAWLGLVACGRHEASDAGVVDAGLTAQQFCDAIRDTCAFEARCGEWTTKEACEIELAVNRADTSTPCERWGAALAWGRMTFDQRAAEHCLAAREACDYGEAVRSCDDVFLGAVSPDGGCYAHEDCLRNFYCASDGTCPGHCAPKKNAGATATSSAECLDGVMWDDITCSGYLIGNQQCIGYPYEFFECGPELYCDGPSHRCHRYKKAGVACGFSESKVECEPGLDCARQLDGGWACEPHHHLGDACSRDAFGALRGSCQNGLLCTAGVCSLPLALGEACRYSYECDERLQCGDGHCAPQVAIDQPCDGYHFCEPWLECRTGRLPDAGFSDGYFCVPPALPPTYSDSCPNTGP